MTWLRWLFAVIVVVVIGFLTMASLKPRPPRPTKVQIAKAERTTIVHTVTGAGKLEPPRKVNVSSNITGTLMDLQVAIGSEVKAGQYLGQIDTSRYRTQVAGQRASVEAASAQVQSDLANLKRLRSELDRVERLFSRGAANVGEVEQARTAVRVAEAQLESAKSRAQVARASLDEANNNLGWATLRAPLDGTVLALNHRVGERVRGSDFSEDVVLVIGSGAGMNAKIEVSEADVVHIRSGQDARLEVDALPDRPLHGEVTDIGRDAIVKNAGTDAEVTTFPVWLAIHDPPPEALSGMSAQVTITTETHENVVAVPIQAVTVRAAEAPPGGRRAAAPGRKLEKVVFVVKDGKVEKRPVNVGLSSDTSLEVVSGLAEGEVVVEGPYRTLARELRDGASVDVMPQPGAGPGPGGRGPGGEPKDRKPQAPATPPAGPVPDGGAAPAPPRAEAASGGASR